MSVTGPRGAGRADDARGAVGRAPAHLPDRDVGPVHGAVRAEREVVGPVDALLGAPTADGLAALGIDRENLRADDAGDVEVAVGAEHDAVRPVQRSALGQHADRGAGRAGLRCRLAGGAAEGRGDPGKQDGAECENGTVNRAVKREQWHVQGVL